jgi:hypothetical protein
MPGDQGVTMQSFEEILSDQWALVVDTYEVRELVLKLASNRYLVRSALQKSIRRGYVQRAMDYASYLYHFDMKKVWRDLAIIAIEDIGVGCPDAVSLALYMDKHSKERSAYRDQLETLMAVVAGLALANRKSRACCELSLGADLLSRRMTASADWDFLPPDAEVMFNNDERFFGVQELLPLYEELLKARGKMSGFPKNPDVLDVLMEAYRDTLSDSLFRMAHLAIDRAHDSMFMAAFPVAFAYSGTPVDDLPDSFPKNHYIKGVPAAAFDMHTHPGRVAIKAFYTHFAKEDLRVAAIQSEFAIKTLGSVVFTEEGGLCNNQIDFLNLKAFQDQFFHLGFGVPIGSEDFLIQLVRDHIDVLHQKREWASTL